MPTHTWPKAQSNMAPLAANKFGRLANGVGGRIKGTNIIVFITKDQVTVERRKDVTYGSYNWNYKPTKTKNGELNSPLEEREKNTQTTAAPQQRTCSSSKYFWTVFSWPKEQNASWSTSKTSTLNTPMKQYEYMQLIISEIPDKIIKEYNLSDCNSRQIYILQKYKKGCMAYLKLG